MAEADARGTDRSYEVDQEEQGAQIDAPQSRHAAIKSQRRKLVKLQNSVAIFLTVFFLFVGYVVWRLSVGTMSMAMLTPLVEQRLSSLIGQNATIGAVRLGWDKIGDSIVVSATDVEVKTGSQSAPLKLANVSLSLDPVALIQGRGSIQSAQISGVTAILAIDAQGQTALGFGTIDQILAQVRVKREVRSVRYFLDSLRASLNGQIGHNRFDGFHLNDIDLVIIDPDTKETLTLNDTHLRIGMAASKIMDVGISTGIQEMSGYALLGLASSEDNSKPIAFQARLRSISLRALPTSIRPAFQSQSGGTIPSLSASVSGDLRQTFADSRGVGDLQFERGKFVNLELTQARARVQWDAASKSISIKDGDASGPHLVARGLNAQITALAQGGFEFQGQAIKLAFAQPKRGGVSGDNVAVRGVLDRQYKPVLGSLSGAQLQLDVIDGVSRPTRLLITQFLLGTNTNPSSGPTVTNLAAQTLSGTFLGMPIDGEDMSIAARGISDWTKPKPVAIDLQASRFASTLRANQISQSFDARGVVLVAHGFDTTTRAMWAPPRFVDLRISEIFLPAESQELLIGRVAGVTIAGQREQNGRLSLSGRVLNAATNRAFGSNIAFELNQTAPQAFAIHRLQADSLGVSSGGGVYSANDLRLSNANYAQGGLTTSVTAGSVTLTHTEQLVRPFHATQVQAAGHFTSRSAQLSQFHLRHRGVMATGNGQIVLASRGSPRVDLEANIDGAFSVETLMSAWPRRFLRETRSAINSLVPAGVAEVQKLRLAIPAGIIKGQILPPDAIDLRFSIQDARIQYLKQMSPITSVSGEGHLTGTSLDMSLPTGRIDDILLRAGKVTIPQFMPRGARALIRAQISGDATQMAVEVDQPSLRVFSNAGFDPLRLSGVGEGLLQIDLPLQKNLTGRDIILDVQAQFRNARMKNAFAGLDATDGVVALDIGDRIITVRGKAGLAGNLLDFQWRNDSNQASGYQVTLTAYGDIQAESLRELDIDLTQFAQGPIGLNVQTTMEGIQIGRAVVDADFARTTITSPGQAWVKPAGVSGSGSALVYTREGGGWNVQDIRLDSNGASLRGAVDVSRLGDVVDARFSRVQIDNVADLSVDVTPTPQGINVALRGAFLNLAPYLGKRNVTQTAVNLLDRPMTLSADVAHLTTGPNREVFDVHADIIRDQTGWRLLEAAGNSPSGRSTLQLNGQIDGRRTIVGNLSDAGFFAQLLYPGAPIFGGTAIINGELPVAGANSSGTLTFVGKDIRLERANSAPILFDLVDLPMRVQGGVITLKDGQADGEAYTVKAAGFVDVGAGRFDLRGVATPGGLNRALGDIPLFGGILGGGQDEGLLGLTFTANGPLAMPRVQTNPISALAPGFLRKLFETEAPLGPQPVFTAPAILEPTRVTKWPSGPTEDMSESGPAMASRGGPNL